MIPFLAQVSSETPISLWPFMILMVCVVFIVVAITQLRVHAFLALILAAFLAGLMTGDLPDTNNLNKGLFHSRVALDTSEMSGNNWNKAVTWSPWALEILRVALVWSSLWPPSLEPA